jgi:hypothetical protein
MCAERSRPAAPISKGAEDPQGEQPDERRAAPELMSVFAVERGGVPGGILRRRIALLAARAAATGANPTQGVPFAPEAKSVPDEGAAPQ